MNDHKFSNKRAYRPMKLSESLGEINSKLFVNYSKIEYIIYSKWGEIVGDFFVKHSEPKKISIIYNSNNKDKDIDKERKLHVNVAPSAALEFQHFQDKIIEKINSFFGYKAINGIIIHQKFEKNIDLLNKNNVNENLNSVEENKKIKNTTSKINDKKLKESLEKLGFSLSKEDNK